MVLWFRMSRVAKEYFSLRSWDKKNKANQNWNYVLTTDTASS